MNNIFNNLKKKKLYIFPISDLHLGSPACNLDYFDYWKTVFKKTRTKNKIIYLLGDMIDFQSLRVGAWDFDATADEQILHLQYLLKPYRKYIRYIVPGNHTLRGKKDFNLDIGRVVADRLNVPYSSTDFFDTLEIDHKPFVIYGKHGTRFSKNQKLAEKNFIADCAGVNADLCLQGHNHYASGFDSVIRTAQNLKLRYYGFTGNYIQYYNSYARRKGSTVMPESFMKFSIDKNLKVNWQTFNIIKERPDLIYYGD